METDSILGLGGAGRAMEMSVFEETIRGLGGTDCSSIEITKRRGGNYTGLGLGDILCRSYLRE